MQLSEKDLDEFITAYETDVGRRLDKGEALEIATRLLNLYLLVAKRPLPMDVSDPS